MNNQLPNELSFIDSYRIRPASLESAEWLRSDFWDPVWKCRFGKVPLNIDFRIRLDDKLFLTDPNHSDLLGHIKRFLCLQTHRSISGKVVLADKTQSIAVHKALHVIDYFLLQSHRLKISTHGFDLITDDDIKGFIYTLSQHCNIKASIYRPLEKIVNFLQSISIDAEELLKASTNIPEILDIYDAEQSLPLNPAQLISARIWLYKNGFYRYDTKYNYKFELKRRDLANYVLGNHVLSNLKFDDLPVHDLNFAPRERYRREFNCVPVTNTNEDERASTELVLSYLAILRSMKFARKHGIQLVPDHALAVVDDNEFLSHGLMKEKGHFTTLPFEVANRAFSKAIEFYIEYGEALVNYYIALASRDVVHPEELTPLDTPDSRKKLEVNKWSINDLCSRPSFFQQLRSGVGLYQMFQILIGAIAILANTLMARRSSELLELTLASIVKDGKNFFLAFNMRKANFGEMRERMLRPLPDIAAEAFFLLARLSSQLRKLGHSASPTLFQLPLRLRNRKNTIKFGTVSLDHASLALCLDRFCDYAELPLDKEGRRFYIRIHQLRRYFAMLFFWHGSFGGIEVLRHFLGHSKPSMTYQYVTETIPGKVLQQVKASLAGQLIKMDHKATDLLAQFICDRYNLTSDDLHILPEKDVVSYIEDLLETKEVEIEPEFVDGPNGEEFTVIYKVIKLY